MKKPYQERQPNRHAHGPLIARGIKSRFSETKGRIRRWAKRVKRRLAAVLSRDE